MLNSRRQGLVGLGLAATLMICWLAVHIYSVFFLHLADLGLVAAPFLILLTCWLNVGLFIIAHDAMHGSLAPTFRVANLFFGRVALLLYAGFDIRGLQNSHHQHHSVPGTSDDPDFNAAAPTRFWPWYFLFMRRNFGTPEFLRLCLPVALYLMLGARIANLLLMWALPALLSSLQLFAFGTYLPHRHDDRTFADRHRAHSSGYSWPISLITCFHFGYHHEHHLFPEIPWWQLPSKRREKAPAR